MFVTVVNFALKAKTRVVMVMMESVTSGHRRISFRDKQEDRKELLAFDPYVQMMTVYKELKKIRTTRGKFNLKEDRNLPKFNEKGELIPVNTQKRRIPTLGPDEQIQNA